MSERTEQQKPRQQAYGFGTVTNPPLIEGYAALVQEPQQAHAVGSVTQDRS